MMLRVLMLPKIMVLEVYMLIWVSVIGVVVITL